jgi:hypothetical protein
MYHPSIFADVPRDEPGVYVLRREIKPYIPKRSFQTVDRVGVVGSAGSQGVYARLKQYFCEWTDTAMSPNYRNVAMAVREQITHIDCYFEPEEIMNNKSERLAFERILIEEEQPMMRTPEERSNIAPISDEIAKDKQFRERVISLIRKPDYTIRLPNRDNIIADLLELNPELYGTIVHKKIPGLDDY